MARTPQKTRYLPRTRSLTYGPVIGCRDSQTPTTAAPNLARVLINMVRESGPTGAAQVGRPGTEQLGAPLGSVINASAFTWFNFDGIAQTVAVVDGEIYAYDWTLDAWTKVVSTAQMAAASPPVALSVSERVSLTPFADALVVSDNNVHLAFSWDGTAGSAGITRLPKKFKGPPDVYYSKLVGHDGKTLYWSEEGDATIGYDLQPAHDGNYYNNAWDHPGGYADPMTAIKGTNEALYVFRGREAIAILGAMGPDFQTAGTRANLSPDVGTNSPYAVYETAKGVVVVDADANPWLFHYGQPEPLALWQDCLTTTRQTPKLSLPNALMQYDEAAAVLLIGLPGIGRVYANIWLCFNIDDLQYNGQWNLGEETFTTAPVIDGAGVKRWSRGYLNGGRIVAHGTPVDGPWNDVLDTGESVIAHEVVGPQLGYDPLTELTVRRNIAVVTNGTRAVTLAYETSRGTGLVQTVQLISRGGFILGRSLLGVDRLGRVTASAPAHVGVAGRGNWVSQIVRHEELNQPFGLAVGEFLVSSTQGNPLMP